MTIIKLDNRCVATFEGDVPQPRHYEDWLEAYLDFVSDSESSTIYWQWSGLVALAGAIGRNVYIPWGRKQLYPNLYVLLVGHPGLRKDPPISMCRDFLRDIGAQVAADAATKRAMQKFIFESGLNNIREINGSMQPVCAVNYISAELSTLLSSDIRDVCGLFTHLWDSPDKWEYQTAGVGADTLHNVTLNILAATQPIWIVENLPRSVIGGGFMSRFIITYAEDKKLWRSTPPVYQDKIYEYLLHDLTSVSKVKGECIWHDGAFEIYDKWYIGLRHKNDYADDQRIMYNMNRIHVQVLKVAMLLSASKRNTRLITEEDITMAIQLVEFALKDASKAFGAMGKNEDAEIYSRIQKQIQERGMISVKELLKLNIVDAKKSVINDAISYLKDIGVVDVNYKTDLNHDVMWKG